MLNHQFILLINQLVNDEVHLACVMQCYIMYVRHQEYLGKESGVPEGVKTASIALLEIPKAVQDKYDTVPISQVCY